MISPTRVHAVEKLAVAGAQAGLSLEHMIRLLNSGMSVIALLEPDYLASGSFGTKLSCGLRSTIVWVGMMSTCDRYLHFDDIDMDWPGISSRCSQRGQTFNAEANAAERVDEVLLRIRADFNATDARSVPIARFRSKDV